MAYKFSIYHFSDKEIDQIIRLAKDYASGRLAPIDLRTISKQVQQYALNWRLMVKAEEMQDKEAKSGRLYVNNEVGNNFIPYLDLPIEALYRLVKEIFNTYPGYDETRSIGYSITKSQGWFNLNIAPAGHNWHSRERDLEEMYNTLSRLAQFGYIIFQFGGSIWNIQETSNRAIREEN